MTMQTGLSLLKVLQAVLACSLSIAHFHSAYAVPNQLGEQAISYSSSAKISVHYTYTDFGQAKTITSLGHSSVSHYDDLGQKIAAELSKGDGQLAATYARNLWGKVIQKTLHQTINNQVKEKSGYHRQFNLLGQTTQEINAAGQVILHTYNANGKLTTTTQFNGSVIHYAYDVMGRVVKRWLTDAQSSLEQDAVQYIYAPDTGHLIQVIYGPGQNQSIHYIYYPTGKLSHVVYQDSKIQRQRSITYDALGRPLQSSDYNHLTTNYHYDSQTGLLTQATSPIGSIRIHHDGLNRTKIVARGNQVNTIYNYDFRGRIADETTLDLTLPRNRQRVRTLNYRYDDYSNVIQKTSTSDTDTSDATNFVAIYNYDFLNRLKTSARYRLLSSLTEPLEQKTYRYDINNNVVQLDTFKSGQKAQTIYHYNKLDQIIDIQNSDHGLQGLFSYTINGSMLSDNQGNHYTYNRLNQLVKFTDPKGVETTYNYYPSGLRATKTTADGTTYHYYYQGNQLINTVAKKAGQTQIASYLMLGKQRIARRVAGKTKYSIHDRHGSVIANLGDDHVGTAQAYSDYGISLISTQKTALILDNPFRFSGEYFDAESRLYYQRARYYNPALMRFMTRDSANMMNRYGYANGNPIMNVDPSGHSSVSDFVPGSVAGGLGLAGSSIASILIGIGLTSLVGTLTEGMALPIASVITDALVGAGVNGATSGLAQALQYDGRFSWERIWASAAVGAVAGAVAGGVRAGFLAKTGEVLENEGLIANPPVTSPGDIGVRELYRKTYLGMQGTSAPDPLYEVLAHDLNIFHKQSLSGAALDEFENYTAERAEELYNHYIEYVHPTYEQYVMAYANQIGFKPEAGVENTILLVRMGESEMFIDENGLEQVDLWYDPRKPYRFDLNGELGELLSSLAEDNDNELTRRNTQAIQYEMGNSSE